MTSEKGRAISKVLCINWCILSWDWNLNSPIALAVIVSRANGGFEIRDRVSVTSENTSFVLSDMLSSPNSSDPAELHLGELSVFY